MKIRLPYLARSRSNCNSRRSRALTMPSNSFNRTANYSWIIKLRSRLLSNLYSSHWTRRLLRLYKISAARASTYQSWSLNRRPSSTTTPRSRAYMSVKSRLRARSWTMIRFVRRQGPCKCKILRWKSMHKNLEPRPQYTPITDTLSWKLPIAKSVYIHLSRTNHCRVIDNVSKPSPRNWSHQFRKIVCALAPTIPITRAVTPFTSNNNNPRLRLKDSQMHRLKCHRRNLP